MWTDQDAHRLQEGGGRPGPLAVVQMPNVEQLENLTAVRIVGFDGVNPPDRMLQPSARGGVLGRPLCIDCARTRGSLVTKTLTIQQDNLVIHGIARY